MLTIEQLREIADLLDDLARLHQGDGCNRQSYDEDCGYQDTFGQFDIASLARLTRAAYLDAVRRDAT
jgi:hypothetical protein